MEGQVAPVPVRSGFDVSALCAGQGVAGSGPTRRLLPWAVTVRGDGLQTVRAGVVAFNADSPNEPIDGGAPGTCPCLIAEKRDALKALVGREPTVAAHEIVGRRLYKPAKIHPRIIGRCYTTRGAALAG